MMFGSQPAVSSRKRPADRAMNANILKPKQASVFWYNSITGWFR